MAQRRRRRILRSAREVPADLVGEVIADMADRMSGSPEARRCVGLSFTFIVTDNHEVPPARYDVGPRGEVTVERGEVEESTFTFLGGADTFDAVLRGREGALGAILRRRIRLHGSLSHIRQLLRLLPTVNQAYADARTAMIGRYDDVYDFRF